VPSTGVPIRDPWTSIVRDALRRKPDGRLDGPRPQWSEDIEWSVPGEPPIGGPHRGREAVLAYHSELMRLTGGTFRQRLLALEGGGPFVCAYLRTEARRRGNSLSMPTLLVFELGAGRITRVSELPGDLAQWETFWA
jgi:ketosteroid isomerase-like protein